MGALPLRLAELNHRAFFEGQMMPVVTPSTDGRAEEEAVFEGSIDCNPYDADTRLRMPVVNFQIYLGHWVLALDPDGVAEVATKLRNQADLFDNTVRPALIAAREDWAAHHPDEN